MAAEPKVTGLSPMTGPPGTKITVRGENFGQSGNDIVKLTINGADCLPYLEWKSPKKIITRCTKALGSGDVIITTNSGGVGTCDVQFNCHEQVVGPIDESAVWVEENYYQTVEKEKHTIAGTVIDEYSLEISSTRFKPQHYLMHNHSDASLIELEQLHKTLKADLINKSNPEVVSSSSNRAALLKSNLPVIMECLQILEHLSKVITTTRDTSVDNIVKSIKESLSKTHELFDPLLEQKDLVQRIENEVQVFRQNETLFNLPLEIENSIKSKNYDSVVKEIGGVLSRLKTINIDQSRAEKIKRDVTDKVEKLKATIEGQLHQMCTTTSGQRNIDEVRKLISHLNRLGPPVSYDVWVALKEMSESLISSLTEKSDHFRKLCLDRLEVLDNGESTTDTKFDKKKEPPPVVQFVQSALNIFHNTYYDILTLGQSYFDPKDEFACKEFDDLKQTRQMEFDREMITIPIHHFCILLRSALVPDSSKLEKPSPWPSYAAEGYADWIRHVLQSVINCHINLTKVSLPLTARSTLEEFKEFVIDLRVKSMEILFGNATRLNKNLHHDEDWIIEVDDLHGGITKLPRIFERNVIDTLRFADDTIFKTSLPDEKSILEGYNVQASMKGLTQSLINSFIDSLDNALNDTKEHPAESTRVLVACRDSSRAPSKHMNRLLVTICNCQYTKNHVFIKLEDEFKKLQGLTTVKVFEVCGEKYSQYINKLSERFCNIKYMELSRGLDVTKHNRIEGLQINLMILNSQIFLIAPQLVNNLMTSIVNKIQEAQASAQSKI